MVTIKAFLFMAMISPSDQLPMVLIPHLSILRMTISFPFSRKFSP